MRFALLVIAIGLTLGVAVNAIGVQSWNDGWGGGPTKTRPGKRPSPCVPDFMFIPGVGPVQIGCQ